MAVPFAGGPLWESANHSVSITTNGDGSLTLSTFDGTVAVTVTATQLQDRETVALVQRLSVNQDTDTNLAELQARVAGDSTERWDSNG